MRMVKCNFIKICSDEFCYCDYFMFYKDRILYPISYSWSEGFGSSFLKEKSEGYYSFYDYYACSEWVMKE